MNGFVLGAALLATVSSPAFAQDSTSRGADSARVNTRSATDSSAAGRHNWFASLVRKIARQSEDTVAIPLVASRDSAAAHAAPAAHAYTSRKDSIAWENARTVAEKAEGYRVVVDLFNRELHVIDHNDTLRTAPVATAMKTSLAYGNRVWRFETPRGVRVVRSKDKDPIWTPPDWHFAEVALEHHLRLVTVERGHTIKLRDGTRLKVEGDEVGIIRPGTTEFIPMSLDEHIVFDSTLFIPPGGTKQRAIEGELGHFRLDLGAGYLLHGTPYAKSIGAAVTHGCVRLRDEDIEWLYDNVPVGTKVYIY